MTGCKAVAIKPRTGHFETASRIGIQGKHLFPYQALICLQSPNFEHLKYAQQWIDAYPEAASYACPGLIEAHPEIKFTDTVGVDDSAPASWPKEVSSACSPCLSTRSQISIYIIPHRRNGEYPYLSPFTGRLVCCGVRFLHILLFRFEWLSHLCFRLQNTPCPN